MIRVVFKSLGDFPPSRGWRSGWIPSIPTQSCLTHWYTCGLTGKIEQKCGIRDPRSCLHPRPPYLRGLLFCIGKDMVMTPALFLEILIKTKCNSVKRMWTCKVSLLPFSFINSVSIGKPVRGSFPITTVAQGELVKEVLCHVASRAPSLLLRINTH